MTGYQFVTAGCVCDVCHTSSYLLKKRGLFLSSHSALSRFLWFWALSRCFMCWMLWQVKVFPSCFDSSHVTSFHTCGFMPPKFLLHHQWHKQLKMVLRTISDRQTHLVYSMWVFPTSNWRRFFYTNVHRNRWLVPRAQQLFDLHMCGAVGSQATTKPSRRLPQFGLWDSCQTSFFFPPSPGHLAERVVRCCRSSSPLTAGAFQALITLWQEWGGRCITWTRGPLGPRTSPFLGWSHSWVSSVQEGLFFPPSLGRGEFA